MTAGISELTNFVGWGRGGGTSGACYEHGQLCTQKVNIHYHHCRCHRCFVICPEVTPRSWWNAKLHEQTVLVIIIILIMVIVNHYETNLILHSA